MSEMPLDDLKMLAHEAEMILSSRVYALAMEQLDQGLTQRWAEGVATTPADREELFIRVRGFRLFKAALESYIDAFKLAKAKDDVKVKRAEKNDNVQDL